MSLRIAVLALLLGCSSEEPVSITVLPGDREDPSDGSGDGGDGGDATDPDLDEDGYTEAEGDCDDSDPAISPGSEEVCNGYDDDCDDLIDDADPDVDDELVYLDGDGDGYGETPTTLCEAELAGQAYSFFSGDCDDADGTVFPEAEESCGEVDQDCDELLACEDPDCAAEPECAE